MAAVVFGTVVPLALIACSVVAPYTLIALGVYGVLVFGSERVRRVGRAGLLPSRADPPVVLGGGWSWVLGRKLRPPNVIVCRQGPVDAQGNWWHAGSTIRQVQGHFATKGRSLAGHPSILSATLGGWIATRSHGTGGSLWTPTLGRIAVDDARGERIVLPSKKWFTPDMIVREVEVLTVPNVVCERRLAYLNGVSDVQALLFNAPTYLRAVFVDARSCLAVTWIPTPEETVQGGVELPPLWFLMILPARCRQGLRVERWTRRMTLRTANAFGPDPPLVFATAAMYAHTNFEVIVDGPSSARLVWRICDAFRALFASGAVQGRLELRFGGRTQFLDFDLLGHAPKIERVVATLYEVFGVAAQFSLHPGKMIVSWTPSPQPNER